MFTETKPPPQVGDIVSAYLPVHYNKGMPGPTPRLALVLGLEVDPVQNSIEGLWLTRLSERNYLVRAWDYYLDGRDVRDLQGRNFAQDYVIRTPRIDLLPADGDFIDDFTVHGQVKPYFWDLFEPALIAGQTSHFVENTYGPRGKLPHTVVKTSLASRDSFSDFDYQTIIDMVRMPPFDTGLVSSLPVSKRDKEFTQAQRMKEKQDRDLRRMVHAAFMMAQQTGAPWDAKSVEASALAYWSGKAPEFRMHG
jgi:hypothetical protein